MQNIPVNPHLKMFNDICRNFILLRNGIIATQWAFNIGMNEITNLSHDLAINLWEKMLLPTHTWPLNQIFHVNTVRTVDMVAKLVTLSFDDPSRTLANTLFATNAIATDIWGWFYEATVIDPNWDKYQKVKQSTNSNQCPAKEKIAELRANLGHYESWSYNTPFTAEGSQTATWVGPENVIRPVGDIAISFYFSGLPGVSGYLLTSFGATLAKISNMFGLGYYKTSVLDHLTEVYNQTSIITRNGTICSYEENKTLEYVPADATTTADISSDGTQCVGEGCDERDEL